MNSFTLGSDFFPNKWKSLKIQQQPEYKNNTHLHNILNKIKTLPKLVHPEEIKKLKQLLIQCNENQCFLIQAGDCAERFKDVSEKIIERKTLLLNSMSHILSFYLKKPCVILGRIAGQYAKPRSSPFEVVDGRQVEVFRGEIINDICPTKRDSDPNRMLEAYFSSATIINYLNKWNIFAPKNPEVYKKIYEQNAVNFRSKDLLNKLNFLYENFPENEVNLNENTIFTSHEGLLLDYEHCFIKYYEDKFYACSAHNLWIGERTNHIDEAHIEFFSKVENPVGIKVSTRIKIDELVQTIRKLNPLNEKGKIILITRFGVNKVSEYLSNLCLNVIWICDPMHGNTKVLDSKNKKIRNFDDIKMEIFQTINTLNENSLSLNGLHLEASCEEVTECLGGIDHVVGEEDLETNYSTYCDPRLNFEQSLELTHLIANVLVKGKNDSCSTDIAD